VAEGGHTSSELLDIPDVFRGLHIQNSLNLSWIGVYAIMSDDVTQQYTRRDSEDTLLRIKLPLVCVEGRENPLEIVDQGMGLPGFYNHIVNVGFDKVIFYLILETVLDVTLVCGPHVFEPQRHCRVAVGTERHDKRRLDLVIFVESDLVITRVAIEKGK
jgi:hypothetical protein